MALAYAWRCTPMALRDATGAEIAAMVDLLEELAERGYGNGIPGDPEN